MHSHLSYIYYHAKACAHSLKREHVGLRTQNTRECANKQTNTLAHAQLETHDTQTHTHTHTQYTHILRHTYAHARIHNTHMLNNKHVYTHTYAHTLTLAHTSTH